MSLSENAFSINLLPHPPAIAESCRRGLPALHYALKLACGCLDIVRLVILHQYFTRTCPIRAGGAFLFVDFIVGGGAHLCSHIQ